MESFARPAFGGPGLLPRGLQLRGLHPFGDHPGVLRRIGGADREVCVEAAAEFGGHRRGVGEEFSGGHVRAQAVQDAEINVGVHRLSGRVCRVRGHGVTTTFGLCSKVATLYL